MLRLLMLFIILAASAQAQQFPDRAMRMVVGFAPGGTTDIVARIVAESMSKHFNQQIVVENRGGAGGVPAALVVLQVPADGYTLMLQSGGLNQAEALGTPLPFDAVDAWSPIGLVATSAISLVVTNSLPVTNLRELQAYAKSTDTALRFGSPGVSLVSFLYAQELGIEVEEVRYRGTGAVLNDLIAGRVQAYAIALPGILAQIRAGGLRAIAIAVDRRSQVMPDLLTTKEQGFPNIISASWFGVVVKSGTPSDRRLVLAQALNRTLQDAEVRRKLIEAGLDVAEEANPDSFDSMIREDRDRWRRVVERGNLKQ